MLVAEGNPAEAACLAAGLRRHGHDVVTVHTGSAALRAYEDADIVLLDLELPDLDGLDVCAGIRSVHDIPVIAVTARGSELDRVLGLQAGADDYLVKPYGFRELIARMDAVLRRSRPRAAAAATVISHGSLCIDAHARKVAVAGRPVETTRKEFDLLHLLASHPGTVMSRKVLLADIWGGSWSRRTVDTHVSTLRNKLGASPWIITVRGVGYQMGQA
ncbi:response regulator transcription factor [Actinokineospora sp. G85]|uniref:response regulator transcription factor n=1 Tax=Actinokineospora sp. G85 TaxID=3406626 RepID=UPI003C78FB35